MKKLILAMTCVLSSYASAQTVNERVDKTYSGERDLYITLTRNEADASVSDPAIANCGQKVLSIHGVKAGLAVGLKIVQIKVIKTSKTNFLGQVLEKTSLEVEMKGTDWNSESTYIVPCN